MLPPTNNHSPTPKRHHAYTLVFLLVLLVIVGVLASQRQALYDQWRLYNYVAPTAVANLATQDTMTAYARRIFYVNHPKITSGSDFSLSCPNNGGEKTIILGCYHGGQLGITLLAVNDPLLNGVEQVTAAHEMLHSAYDRLSSSEKKRVDTMLQDYYQTGLKDQRIVSILDAYRKSEPNDVVNEMHSIFGTEISNLPPSLEQYYKRYFTNRAQVAAFAAHYQSEFTSRQAFISSASAQLVVLKSQIDSLESDLAVKLAAINTERSRLDALRHSDPAAYNASIASYNQLVDSYNVEVNRLQALINQYNTLVDRMNAVALEENQLVKELSGTSTTINN